MTINVIDQTDEGKQFRYLVKARRMGSMDRPSDFDVTLEGNVGLKLEVYERREPDLYEKVYTSGSTGDRFRAAVIWLLIDREGIDAEGIDLKLSATEHQTAGA